MLYAGGIWKGDITVADIEELENGEASEIHARRLNAEEVVMPKNGDTCVFPIEDGTVKLAGRAQVFFFEKVHLNSGTFLTVSTDSFLSGLPRPHSSPWGKVDVWRPHSNVSLSLFNPLTH